MDLLDLLPFPFILIVSLTAFAADQRGRNLKEPKVKEEISKEKRWKEFLAERS